VIARFIVVPSKLPSDQSDKSDWSDKSD
jgi:hypothetical protein